MRVAGQTKAAQCGQGELCPELPERVRRVEPGGGRLAVQLDGRAEQQQVRRGAREKVTCFVEREAGTPDPRRGRAAIVLVDDVVVVAVIITSTAALFSPPDPDKNPSHELKRPWVRRERERERKVQR